MATKQISQQTFDDVVRENMREFEMSAEEAMEDAIQQFESQEVNLNIIVKDASLYSSDNGNSPEDHPVIAYVKNLSTALQESPCDEEKIEMYLNRLQEQFDIDLARRCLAGNNGAYTVLFQALDLFRNEHQRLILVLKSFCSLTNGQPDLIDSNGKELLISILNENTSNSNVSILELAVRAIRFNCVKHEGNRQEFIELNLIKHLTELLVQHKTHPVLVKEICICLRSLTLDDDVRVPFGKAHENAKTIVTEGNALKILPSLCEEYPDNKSVLGELFLTLSSLAVRNEFCQEVMERGGVKLILKAFQTSITDKNIVRHALIVLKSLAGNDEVKSEIPKLGGVELVVAAMLKYQSNGAIADAACRVLTAITLRNMENCKIVMECQGHQQIIQAMKLHPSEVNVQKQACMAIRNLVSRTKEFKDNILALGAEHLLNVAMNQHKEVEDEAKAALRDLGCKVMLKELWKGEMGTIQQGDDYWH